MYTIILPRRIERQLDRFSDYTRRIITDRLASLEQNPCGGSSERVRGYGNIWKIRLSSYQIYFEVDEIHQKVIVMAIKEPKP